jgi:phosphatidate cytidylyltransferase
MGKGEKELRAAGSRSELRLRIYSALVLAPLAVGSAYLGGWSFAVFWSLAGLGIFWEWVLLVGGTGQNRLVLAGEATLAFSFALAASGRPVEAVVLIGLGALAIAAIAGAGHRGWIVGGMPYAGAVGLSPIMLRSDSQDGFLAMIFLFAIVWATDSAAYGFGRMIGGGKLLPRVSPKKTWAGAIGGLAAAVLAALATARIASLAASLGGLVEIACLAAILSASAQAGDLFESFVKRRFGAKDSSHLIPGHGGLMDRLDGFVAAATVAAIVGIARAGLEAPARGLLIW